MTTPIVDIRSIDKQFDSKSVLKDLSWQIRPGRIIGLLGRNGAGKSTLLECMLGLRETDAGSVRVFGELAGELSDTVRARIGYVPQSSDLFDWLTPTQMLDYFRALYPHWNPAKVAALLERWGFDAHLRKTAIGKLSGGEKQRLSIIRALAHDPALLILDEPVAALDPVGRREFLRELVNDVIERDTTVVFSTHILSDLERVALDVAFLKDGQIALEGELDSLLDGARRIVAHDGRTKLMSHADPAKIAAAEAAGHRVETLSLEELFIEVTQ